MPLTGPEGRRHCFCFFFHKQQILCHLVFEPNHYNIVKSHLNRLQSRHFVVTIFFLSGCFMRRLNFWKTCFIYHFDLDLDMLFRFLCCRSAKQRKQVLYWFGSKEVGGWVRREKCLPGFLGFENLYKSLRFASPPGGRARTGVEAVLPPASPSSSSF